MSFHVWAQQARVIAITVLASASLGTLGVLVLHYNLSASSRQIENSELQAQVRTLVGLLSNVETAMSRVDEQRKTLDQVTLAAMSAVLGNTEIDPEAHGQVFVATLPAGGLTGEAPDFAKGLGRAESIREKASSLVRDLQATNAVVSLRQNVLKAIPSLMPAKGWISSGFGLRVSPFHGHGERMHNGIDIAADEGTPVYATADGTVAFAGNFGGYGKYIRISHGFGIATRYAHNGEILVKRGQQVHRGDQIAVIGNTGRSTGPHVHYEVTVHEHPVDPVRFFFNDKPTEPSMAAAHSPAVRPMGGELEEGSDEEAVQAAVDAGVDLAGKPAKSGLLTKMDLSGEVLIFAAALPAPLKRTTTSDLMMLTALLVMMTIASSLIRLPEAQPVGGKRWGGGGDLQQFDMGLWSSRDEGDSEE